MRAKKNLRYTHRLSGAIAADDKVQRCLKFDDLASTIVERTNPRLRGLVT
jgi:hypothetical protein